jgi:hypothetical protein
MSVPNFIKEVLFGIRAHIDPNTTIADNFTIPVLSIDRLSRQNINKETLKLMVV